MTTTSSNLNLWLLGGIFVRYLSTKLPPNDVVKGRVVCNILFSTPLRILGECPSQSVQFSKNVLHHFGKPCVFKFTGVYNINGVLIIIECDVRLQKGRDIKKRDAHNQIWGPHFRVLRHWSLRDQRRTAMTSCERYQSKVTFTRGSSVTEKYLSSWLEFCR